MSTLLSIIIPAYNEQATIRSLIEKIQSVPLDGSRFRLEIIVVDDGSKDGTAEIAAAIPNVRVIRQENQGKGAAVQHGVRVCQGDYFLVQDADLEYDPMDYGVMLAKLPEGLESVVYGSRTLGQLKQQGWSVCPGKHPDQDIGPWGMNLLLSLWIAGLYGRWISDALTGYKLYPTTVVRNLQIRSKGFEADHEMTAKLIRREIPIYEVPIRYHPRSVAEGKKIKPRDGLIALWTLMKYRFAS